VSNCDCGSKAAWKSHTFISLQEEVGIRAKSTVEMSVACGIVTVTASLVPKVEKEKGVPNVCCMGGCGHSPKNLEFCVMTNWANSEFRTMADNSLASAKCTTHYISCVRMVGIVLVTMSECLYKRPHSYLLTQCRTC